MLTDTVFVVFIIPMGGTNKKISRLTIALCRYLEKSVIAHKIPRFRRNFRSGGNGVWLLGRSMILKLILLFVLPTSYFSL